MSLKVYYWINTELHSGPPDLVINSLNDLSVKPTESVLLGAKGTMVSCFKLGVQENERKMGSSETDKIS